MAIDPQPVFWTQAPVDKEALLNSLRIPITGMASYDGQVHSALEDVRLGIYQRLGVARTNEISASTPVTDPVDEQGVIRLSAQRLESIWMKRILLHQLPQLWLDASADQNTVFNEDSFSREQVKDVKRLTEELDQQIESLLPVLLESSTSAASRSLQIETISEGVGYIQGQSVFGRGGTL